MYVCVYVLSYSYASSLGYFNTAVLYPQAYSSALASLRYHSQGLWIIISVDPCVMKSNYYLVLVQKNSLPKSNQIYVLLN